MIQQLLYQSLAPLFRWLYSNSITSKPLRGLNFRLYYHRGQHLSFLGKKYIDYEPEYRERILSLVQAGDLVFEIGSNIGQYTLYLSDKVGTQGRVVAIEPDHENFSFLQFNTTINAIQNVGTQHCAVADKEGEAEFHRDTITGGRTSSLFSQYVGKQFKGIKEKVRTITLQHLFEQYGDPALIKVDVEGAEVLVFSSEASFRRKVSYVVEVQKETKPVIFRLFQDHGFTVFDLLSDNRILHHPDEVPDFRVLLFRHNSVIHQ